MTKPRTPHGSGESLRKGLVALIMHPIADLVEKARLDILAKLEHVEDLIDAIASQIRRQIPPRE